MKLAWRYILFYKIQSFIVIFILSLIIATPFINNLLSTRLISNISERTHSSPVIIVDRGGKIKESLHALFFILGENKTPSLTMLDYENIENRNIGDAVPLLIKYKTKNSPLVATNLSYFTFRNLSISKGDLFAFPGDIVIGHNFAKEKKVSIGDLLTVQLQDVYDISKSTPIKLKVTGILTKSSSVDDDAVFTNLQTAWILEGILHQHSKQDPYKKDTEKEVVYSKSLKINQEPTFENILDFHFHGEPSNLPITHIVFKGNTHKAETMLMTEINQQKRLMSFRPEGSIEEVISLFLRVEEFFSRYHIFWSFCSILMLILIFTLIVHNRRDEFRTLINIGASQNLVLITISHLVTLFIIFSILAASGLYLLTFIILERIIL